ncbi:MAG: hypothetical protein CBC35_08485 [Planctomycetes bacterium TMED75]|nr:hypothetical protein [Planctomycetaceae bacterium]OUU91871.1 MAG: hypothetical protein CBC35_08485 [Planctomycetes bacterium TMED75]
MLIYAGIDEAGYGPMLGPLCIGGACFRLEHAEAQDGPPDLWELLAEAVCRKPSDKKRRLAINDSKQLKGAASGKSHPCRHLERGLLAAIASSQVPMPGSDLALYERLETSLPREPWYAGADIELPLAGTMEEHRIQAAVLRRALENRGITIESIRCETVHPQQINEAAGRHERKSALNLAGALRLADQIRRDHPEAHPRIVIDRQGGRQSYREQLSLAWPGATVRILGETPGISRYRLDFPEGPITISFEAGSEENHLPNALASMTAKLVRELHMARLNRFFGQKIPELKPTAGYVQDGRRFMREVDPVCRELALEQKQLVRAV